MPALLSLVHDVERDGEVWKGMNGEALYSLKKTLGFPRSRFEERGITVNGVPGERMHIFEDTYKESST